MSLKNLLGSIKVQKGERGYSLSSVDDIVKMLFNRRHCGTHKGLPVGNPTFSWL